MVQKNLKQARRKKIHFRIRKRISGTQDCPRVSVFKSNRCLYVQIINDVTGTTVLAVDSRKEGGCNMAAAAKTGKALAQKAKKAGITRAVFDRSGYLFHGVIKSLCDALSSNGIQFTNSRS